MDREYADRLLGELIGLARATDGNAHLITDGSTAVIRKSLAALDTLDAAGLEALLWQVEAEKRRMVPNCFCCAAPCGRNNAYDLRQLQQEEPERRERKQQLLTALGALAAGETAENTHIYYKALIAVGIEGIDLSILDDILTQIKTSQI